MTKHFLPLSIGIGPTFRQERYDQKTPRKQGKQPKSKEGQKGAKEELAKFSIQNCRYRWLRAKSVAKCQKVK